MAWIWWKPGDAIDAIARTPISYLGVHRVALDRVAAAHLDGLGDRLGMLAGTRDGELGQVYVEARRVDARGQVLAHLRRHGTGTRAVSQAAEYNDYERRRNETQHCSRISLRLSQPSKLGLLFY